MEERRSINDLVAEEIRVHLARRRMSASDLARLTGMTQRAISRRLTGEKVIDVDDLEKIAKVLNLEVAELLPRVNEGRTVVFADGTRKPTTVPYSARTKQPHLTGHRGHSHSTPGTRRTVRLSQART